MQQLQKYFTQKLLHWNKTHNNRTMPWKGEKDPYKIWLSEVILQQTRVEQGWDYYQRFVSAYPTVQLLAKAPETEIFKLWEGLGYYTRCKNLIATAKFIARECKGNFPDKYEDILKLKGIGPYTAAAIASFAFNLPHAVIDGNVFRILARFFGVENAINSTEGKKIFTTLAYRLINKKQPGAYNQAIMDFGAIVCKPKPLCNNCMLQNKCTAYLAKTVEKLPVKEKNIVKKIRWFYYLLVEYKGKVYVRKRLSKDIWQNLYEFILVETPQAITMENLKQTSTIKQLPAFEMVAVSKLYRQQLTHQIIQAQIFQIKVKKSIQLPEYKAIPYNQIKNLPFPKTIADYLSENTIK